MKPNRIGDIRLAPSGDPRPLNRFVSLLTFVTCQAPDTGQIRVFLTTETTLPPGLIAHLYHRRWQIEKVFDSLKIKLNEKKSWATSETARSAQAQFLCLTHNLTRRMEHQLATQEAVVNQLDLERQHERLAEQKTTTEKAVSQQFVCPRKSRPRKSRHVPTICLSPDVLDVFARMSFVAGSDPSRPLCRKLCRKLCRSGNRLGLQKLLTKAMIRLKSSLP